MKTASILCAIVASLCLSPVAISQRTLDEAQTEDILRQLTSKSYTTWVAAGTIEATHQEYGAPKITDSATINNEIANAVRQYQQNTSKRELTTEMQKMALDAIPFNVWYKLANEYSMVSRHTVKYDGNRFYWEIDVSSRSDSIPLEPTLVENPMTDEFDMAWNQQRIFAWDGQKYTTYAASGGQAIVDAAGKLGTPVVTGPLTAGLIPWGNGKFTYASLSTASISAAQTDAQSVQMTIDHADGTTSDLILDTSKAYAVTGATLTTPSGLVVTYTLSGYKSIGGRWVPSSVAIERKNLPIESHVPTSEQWTFTSISTATPSLSSFNVAVAMDDLVEYISPGMASSAIYTNSYEADTDELLAERIAYYRTAKGPQRQNCATAAFRHVATAFGKPVSSAALAGLVGSNGSTNLYDLKQFALGLGLYGRVVKTDLAGLETLGTAKAILHIPGKNHFVVVDRVDDQYVWLVDLSSRKFYYRQSLHFFPLEWTEGTALLLSDRPISGQLADVPDGTAKSLAGGAYYACNTLMQEFDWVACEYVSGLCQGYFTIYFEIWTCGQAPSGTCTFIQKLLRQKSPCIPDPIAVCTYTGEWRYYNTTVACD
jgi:hypothetical protein